MRTFLAVAAGLFLGTQTHAVVINEFVANHVGSDTNEFIELFGNPLQDFSSLRVLEIEGDSTSQGTLDRVYVPGVADPFGFFTFALSNQLENGSLTLLLVDGFTGNAGTDLDTDNDGVLDVTPWTAILDSVAVFDGGASDLTYSPATLTPGFDGSSFTVGGASRIPNGIDTDTPADWVRNDFDGFGLPGFPGTPVIGEAINTPGAVNNVIVPEPTTLAALGLGLGTLLRRRR